MEERNLKPWPRTGLHGLLQQASLIKHYDDISIIHVSRTRAGLKLE